MLLTLGDMGQSRAAGVTVTLAGPLLFAIALGGLTACATDAERAVPLFNGRDLNGWHISETAAHGATRSWRVEGGVLVANQDPPGTGGLLLTDRRFADVEVSLDVRIDPGCDSGLFLRSSDKGEGYQVTIDHVEDGAVGSIYGEQIADLGAPATTRWREVWRDEDWNTLRVRMEGDAPRIRVWLNDTLLTDWRDTANHAAAGASDGFIGLQVHNGGRWRQGGQVRFRDVTARELRR